MMIAETTELQTRSLTMLNEAGDTTVSWSADRDDEMESIIKKKMAEGVTFFLVDRKLGRPPATPKRAAKLEDAADIRKYRTLVIPDEDLLKFVEAGSGVAVAAPSEPVQDSRISRDPAEVAKGQSVGIKQRRGG